jgi:hypothetical protein
MRKSFSCLAFSLVLLLALPVLAVDYWGGPPPDTWTRGAPGSTFEHWDFTSEVLFEPEVFDNPYGIPFSDPIGGWEWWPEWECPPELSPTGFVDGWHCIDPAGGTLVLNIPNQPDPNGVKFLFIQITSTKFPSDVSVDGGPGTSSGTWSTGQPHIQWPGPAPFGGVWYTYNLGRFITPNPEGETVTITVPECTVIDQIVIDTICTVEPIATEASTLGQIKALYR